MSVPYGWQYSQCLSGASSVGGVDSNVQYNNGGTFGGSSNFVFDDGTNRVGIGTDSPNFMLHIVGDTSITGTLYATEFQTTLISSSIIYDSGSTKFGDTADDLHQFTGSVGIIGDLSASLNISASSFYGDGSNLTGIVVDLQQVWAFGS